MHPSKLVATLCLAVAAAACRSAAPTARPAVPEAPSWLDGYLGRTGIVVGLSDARGLSLSRADLDKPRPACDVAVAVRAADFDNQLLTLRLEVLGRPHVETRGRRRSACAKLGSETRLRLTGFTNADREGVLQAALDRVLLTSEAYLLSQGRELAAAPVDDPKAALANSDPTASPEQQSLWRKLLAPARPLLTVDAEIHPARKTRYEGEIQFRAVVGVDGRLRDGAQILTPLAPEQETHVRRVLGLWRFAPARGPQGAVASALESRLILKLD